MTRLNAAVDRIAQMWVATNPATSGPAYWRLDSTDTEALPETLADEHADRGFYFTAEPSVTIQETADDLELVETPVIATLVLSPQRVGPGGLRAAFSTELQALSRAVDLQTSWPSGVSEVRCEERGAEDYEGTEPLASGTITIILLTEESQS